MDLSNHYLSELKSHQSFESRTAPVRKGLLFLYILYLLAFSAAEYVTYSVKDSFGVVLYFLLLFGLILHSAFTSNNRQRQLWLTLGLVPLIKITCLVVPVAEIPPIYWYVMISIPILVGIWAVVRTLKFSLDDIGLNFRQPVVQILVAHIGIDLGLVDYFILKPGMLTDSISIQATFLPAIILLVSTGLVEEIVFRGVIQRAAGILGSWGWIFVALIYTVLQISHGPILHCVFILAVSLSFGWVVKKTGSIIGVSLAHGLLNVGMFLIFPHIF